MADDTDRAWRRRFTPHLHPHLPLLESLHDLADKLTSALEFLDVLADDNDTDRQRGLSVAAMAIDYANTMLEHFGLLDDPVPFVPTKLEQGRVVLRRQLNFVREHIKIGEHAGPMPEPSETPPSTQQALTPTTTPVAPAPEGLVIDDATFTVRWKDKTCTLGNKKEFHLLRRLAQSPGQYIHYHKLIDAVWGDSEPEKGTVQKTVSNLRKKLAAAGLDDIDIDGTEKDHYRLKLP